MIGGMLDKGKRYERGMKRRKEKGVIEIRVEEEGKVKED